MNPRPKPTPKPRVNLSICSNCGGNENVTPLQGLGLAVCATCRKPTAKELGVQPRAYRPRWRNRANQQK